MNGLLPFHSIPLNCGLKLIAYTSKILISFVWSVLWYLAIRNNPSPRRPIISWEEFCSVVRSSVSMGSNRLNIGWRKIQKLDSQMWLLCLQTATCFRPARYQTGPTAASFGSVPPCLEMPQNARGELFGLPTLSCSRNAPKWPWSQIHSTEEVPCITSLLGRFSYLITGTKANALCPPPGWLVIINHSKSWLNHDYKQTAGGCVHWPPCSRRVLHTQHV